MPCPKAILHQVCSRTAMPPGLLSSVPRSTATSAAHSRPSDLPIIPGRLANRKRNGNGKLSTHWRMGCLGSTSSTSKARALGHAPCAATGAKSSAIAISTRGVSVLSARSKLPQGFAAHLLTREELHPLRRHTCEWFPTAASRGVSRPSNCAPRRRHSSTPRRARDHR
jgi:hypothetical protein